MPKIKEYLFGKSGKTKQKSLLNPEQAELIKLIKEGLETGQGSFGDVFGDFDKDAFDKGVSQPAIKNFQENILPLLQEKFISGNQVMGSGRLKAEASAASDLQSKLAGLMYQAQQQQKQNKIAGMQTALNPKAVENVYKPGTQGLVQGAVEGFAEGAGKAATAAIAG